MIYFSSKMNGMKSFVGLQTGMNGMGFNTAQNNYNPNFAYNNKEPFLQI